MRPREQVVRNGSPIVKHFRRNEMLGDLLHRHPTAGLPLFAAENQELTSRERRIVKDAPRAIQVATETRNLAHRTLIYNTESLSEKQRGVLGAIVGYWNDCGGDITNTEIAETLLWPINRVVGRTFELRQLGLVLPSERRACRVTGYIVWAWKPNEFKLFGNLSG